MIKKLLLVLSLTASSTSMLSGMEADQLKNLWLACKSGNEKQVTELLKNGVDSNTRLLFGAPLDEEGCDNTTCLHYAASEGHLGVVNILFYFGAHPNPCDENGWTPLIGALARGHEAVVDCLIKKGARVNIIDKLYGHRPIATPVQCLNPRLVRTLLKAGAQVIPPPMIFHQGIPLQLIYEGSALHILCERLLNKPRYAPEYDEQETEDRALEIIEMVRAHGIDMAHLNDEDSSVFHVAAQLNNRRIIAALLVSSNYTDIIRKQARASFRTALLCNQRNGNSQGNPKFSCEKNSLVALPHEVMLRIFSHMPIECKQVGIEQLIVPYYTSAVSMRTRYLDACFVDIKRHSWHTVAEVQALLKVLGMINQSQNQACDLTQDTLLQNVINPIYWH